MKKRVSVRELKEYCKEHKPHCLHYSSENQSWYRVSDPCKLEMSFPIMLIYENPNLICLRSGSNTLSFDCVKSVEIDTESTVLGTIFTVFCGDFKMDGGEVSYTLVDI